MQFVLLLGFSFAFIVPGYLWNRPASNGGRDSDRISGTDTHKVVGHDINRDERWDC